MPDPVVCQYCGKDAILVKGDTVYPHRPDLADKYFWLCRPCNAYVGCHPGQTVALGQLANAETRKARSAAHAAFDPLWKGASMKRKPMYQWLADKLGIDVSTCHIGTFDPATCKKVVELCNKRKER